MQKTFNQKRSTIIHEKKLGKVNYALLIALVIVNIIFYRFLRPVAIGHDIRYSVFFHLVPVMIGMIVLGGYRRSFLVMRYLLAKDRMEKLSVGGFYLLQGFIFSYLTAGMVGKAVWDYVDNKAAEKSVVQTVYCPVERFKHSRRQSAVDFIFHGRYEHFRASHELINQYCDSAVSNYELRLEIREGLWNHYVVDSWEVVRVK